MRKPSEALHDCYSVVVDLQQTFRQSTGRSVEQRLNYLHDKPLELSTTNRRRTAVGTTKIWAIKDSLSRVLDYASNPKKTVYTDLQKVLHYAEQGSKTASDEETCFVTGVNCNAEIAFDEMLSVQRRFGKTGGNVAYHAYQSFKTGEVSREECHQIGVELAKKMWGDEYQMLVATHLDTQTLHNHFVINAVNMWNGKKFNCNEGVYWRFRSLSDQLCAEHRLTVIKNPQGKTPRSIYFAEKNGEPTKFNLMRQAIDYAVDHALSFKEFKSILSDQGYVVNLNENCTYWTIRSVNSKKCVRMIRLGEEYGNQAIRRRSLRKSDRSAWLSNREYYAEQKKCGIPNRGDMCSEALSKSKEVYGNIRPLSSLLLFSWKATKVSPTSAAVAGDERSVASPG